MSIFCPCSGTGTGNTGLASGQLLPKVAERLIFVRMYANDGTRNAIGSGDTLNQAYFDALVNHTDASKRWYPTGKYVSVEMPLADTITESFPDGSSVIVGQNAKTFQGMLLNTPPAYIGKLEALACNAIGFYVVDKCGAPIGEVSSDGTSLYPIAINSGSFIARYMWATDTAVAKLQVNFEIAQSVKDKALRMIKEADLGGADLLNLTGLIDVDAAAATSITTTGFTTSLTTTCGGFISAIDVEGWLAADFALYNETTDAAVTIIGVTESPAGTYAFTFAAQTSADVLTLSGAVSGSAYVKEGYYLMPLSITIP